jgi:hypothetical protein
MADGWQSPRGAARGMEIVTAAPPLPMAQKEVVLAFGFG